MSLSAEKVARARWAGWEAARELLREGAPWRVWLEVPDWRSRLREPEVPGSLRVDALTVRLEADEQAREAAGVMAGALVQALVERGGVQREKLDGRLLAIGANRWYALQDGRLQPMGSESGDLRSVGAILLVLGDHAGETLNAAGHSLRSRLPTTPGGFFDAMAGLCKPKDRQKYIGRLDHVGQVLGLDFKRHLVGLCTAELPAWVLTAAPDAADELGRALAMAAGVHSPGLSIQTQSKGALERLLAGERRDRGRKQLSRDERVDNWLARHGWQDINDGALAALFRREHGFPREAEVRDFFARNRVRAYEAHADAHNGGSKDFAGLAPMLRVGSKRPQKHLSPGLPILDALWAVRGVQEMLPGLVGRGGPVSVTRVAFALRVADPSEAEDDRDPRPPSEARFVLFGEGGSLCLRQFGLKLLTLVAAEERLTRTARQYYVCITLDDGERVIELPVAFPWRFEPPARGKDDEHVLAMRKDAERFAVCARQLAELAVRSPERLSGPLERAAVAMRELQREFTAYREAIAVDGFGAMAGLHTDDATIWPRAEAYVGAYEQVVDHFACLFNEAGDLAPRIAGGPLDTLLGFGIYTAEPGSRATGWRILSYHPVRLRRLQALEADAYRELLDALEQPGTLRDVPITSVPTLRGGPAVLWPPGERPGGAMPSFLVPPRTRPRTEQGRGPWTEPFERFAHERIREPDLIGPVRPILYGLANALLPGMQRRMRVRLDAHSRTLQALRPLMLLADAVVRQQDTVPRVTQGVDLHVAARVDLSILDDLGSLEDDADLEQFRRVVRALTTPREDDPRFPLEIHVGESDAADPDHLILIVNPWAGRSEWVVRQAPEDAMDSPAMTWEPISQSWERLMLKRVGGTSGDDRLPQQLEQGFQELVIRRWRREADLLPRCLGLSLEANPDHPLGGQVLAAHLDAAGRAARVLLVDHVVGAEAFDDVDEARTGLRVTLADFDRTTGWRLTLFCREHDDVRPDRERDALSEGLRELLPDASCALATEVYRATHRALPEVTRYLWRHAGRPGLQKNAELIGHMGVSLFVSSTRGEPAVVWPEAFKSWRHPFPVGTILLSMDSLQTWTWTRRSGTRGDFLAVVPDRTDEAVVWIVAIESKGSEGASLYNGCRQAAIASRKLENRFAGPSRWAERQELMRCLAQEAFRATERHREAHDRVARAYRSPDARIRFAAICVSTCMDGGSLQADRVEVEGTEVLWLRVGGLEGLERLGGC